MPYQEIKITGTIPLLDETLSAAIYSNRYASLFIDYNNIQETLKYLVANNFRILSISDIDETNVHAQCEELWRREHIGIFSIIPIASADQKSREIVDSNSIRLYIIPGMGFGTGHHPTTYSVLEALQKVKNSYKNAIDIGTGSGLLAIAIAKIFSIPVFAFDNDAAAIENAKDNAEINEVSYYIQFETTTVAEAKTEKAELVCANLYSELLIEFSEKIAGFVESNGTLILSGITESRGSSVISTFRDLNFVLTLEYIKKGWNTFVFTKNI